MAEYAGMVLTKQGLDLQAKAQTGAQLLITRVALGEGLITDQSYEEMTELIDAKASLGVQSLEVTGDGQSRIRALITNDNLTTGFFIREVGVFAKSGENGTEVLYSYTNAGARADFLPAKGVNLIEEIIDVFVITGNAQSVTAIMNDRVIIATKEDVKNAVENHDEAIETVHKGMLMHGGMKNLLINGNFDIWQRGTNFINPRPGTFSCDRWLIGNYNAEHSFKYDNTIGKEIGFSSAIHIKAVNILAYDAMIGDSYGATINQIIEEGYWITKGKYVTVSFWAKSKNSELPIICDLYVQDNDGNDGNYRESCYFGVSTTEWKKYTHTYKIIDKPEIEVRTLRVCLGIACSVDDLKQGKFPDIQEGSEWEVYFTGVQLEIGEVATEFEQRPIGLELMLCQRYYEVINIQPVYFGALGRVEKVQILHIISLELICKQYEQMLKIGLPIYRSA